MYSFEIINIITARRFMYYMEVTTNIDILYQLPIPIITIDKSFNINSMNLSIKHLFIKLGLKINENDNNFVLTSKTLHFYNELKAFIGNEESKLSLEKKLNFIEDSLYLKIQFIKIHNYFDDSQLIAILLEDITEYKKFQLSLIQKEEQLNSILNSIPIMMFVLDKDNNIIFWNKECENITGYSQKEAISLKNIAYLLYPDLNYRKQIFNKCITLGDDFKDVESNIICKDGSNKTITWFSASFNLNISNWHSIRFGLNITKRKHIEKCLLNKTSEFELIFKALPDLYFVLDKNGIYIDCKFADQNELYAPKEKFIGKAIEEVMPPDIAPQFKSAIVKALKTNTLVLLEYPLTVKNEIKFYEARFLPLSKDEVIAVIRNITKRKQTDEELLKIEKLNSIGTLAGGVAHDFNNILTIILGNISMLKTYSHCEDKVFKKLVDVEKTVFQAKNLTKQLLTFAKGNKPLKKVTYINDLIKETVDLSLSGSNVICNLSISKDLSPVEIDIGQISQVMNNLVINACQAMPNGGTINIIGRNVHLTDNDILGLKAGNYVKISVKDQGHGISEDNLFKIFDPYFTTKRTGSGLGLTSSYSIIQKHHGKIEVKSKLGKGTIFQIFLPACHSIPIEIVETKSIISKGSKKILIMDDEPEIRDILGCMLKHLGYIVELSKDGQEAIQLYKEARLSKAPFDVVIMDLTIPGGMGGKETIKHLLEIDPCIKAIVSSGYYSGGVIGDYKSHGFKGVINKPYTIEELSNSLSNVLSSC